MHRIFRNALDTATGVSQFIIAVIADIRGFSPFSQTRESPDTAMFIKRVYIKMIDSYFAFASFYKPTGDGLLLTIPYNENNLKEMVQKTVASCIACCTEFGNICNHDPMINFQVPDKIGIGIARGTACCLVSGENTIDYSGHLLNLTSRLTGLARPAGIIIDGSFGIDLLNKDIRGNFEEQDVYLDGIAEHESIKIYFTKEFTVIPSRNREPIVAERWRHRQDVKSLRTLSKCTGWFEYYLESEPANADDIKVIVRYPHVTSGRRNKDIDVVYRYSGFAFTRETGKPIVSLNFTRLTEELRADQVKEDMKVHIDIAYIEK